MPEATLSKIVEELNLPSRAVLLVSSDIVGLAFDAASRGEAFSCDGFIDILQTKLGPEGTLLFPTFNFDFCDGRPYDVRLSPSMTGALSRAALARRDFRRTQHPIHSFAVWGRLSNEFVGLSNQSSFGADSPFALLRRESARMIIIGLPYQGAFTFVHHAEEMEKVPYRYMKNFTSSYTDMAGRNGNRTYSLYVRDIEKGVDSAVDPMGEILETKKISVSQVIRGVVFRTIRLKEAYDQIVQDIRQNGGRRLYRRRVPTDSKSN